LRPNFSFRQSVGEAFQKGFRAAWQNLPAILSLQLAMALTVAAYYCWPAATTLLSGYAAWQHSGGILAAALATALAGGVLSEISLVYVGDNGRWTPAHLENLAFKFGLFFVAGALVYEFYAWQAIWFGQGDAWSVLVPKILVDQCIYTVFWATPFYTLLTRWKALGYSAPKLWRGLDAEFVTERMLPILVTNWMFWLPGVSLIYAMPLVLQTPLFIFATAIWGLLLPAVAQQERAESDAPGLIPPGTTLFANPAE